MAVIIEHATRSIGAQNVMSAKEGSDAEHI